MRYPVRRTMSLLRPGLALVGLASITPACGGDSRDDGALDPEAVLAVTENYAEMVKANYADAREDAEALRAAVDTFVNDPTDANLGAARSAWLAARESYGQSEAYRFYDGPIDDPIDGPEGQLNAWPMDEAYVDYVEGAPDSGIVNDAENYPTIDTELLISLNEAGGETNIATGYHAVEFLLWGQDLSEDGPGDRPVSDYVDDGSNNADRRATYLKAATSLIVSDLQGLEAQWAGDYQTEFTGAAPEVALRNMLLGMGSLSGAELAGERIEVALQTRDQEDEHSCFSDNTHRDIVTNATGIQNVYLGRYGNVSGPSIYELVAQRDVALADRLRDELAASVAAAEAIPAPFDRAIVEHRESVEATVDALRVQADTIGEVAAAFGINLALE